MALSKTIVVIAVSSAALTSAHYGDPYDNGCEKDEVPAQINGIAGEICIPPCNSDGSCPTDVPSGMTATPKCVLDNQQTGQKYCIPVCTASEDAQCGKNASCKQASDNGLCTYDDAPPPPSSSHWKGVVSPSFSELSEALNVAFTKDGSVGFCGAGDNTVGSKIIKTVDQGVTWTQQWPDGNPTFDLFLASAAKSGTEAIVTGVIFNEYTSDGVTFNSSKNDFFDPSQDAKTTPDGKFAVVFNGENKGLATGGVALSSDGRMWQNVELTANVTIYPPRYGAYPTADTWFMSAGNFPVSNTAVPSLNLKHLNHKVAINKDSLSYHFKHGLADNTPPSNKFAYKGAGPPRLNASATDAPRGKGLQGLQGRKLLSPPAPVSCLVDPTNCFSVGLFKTTDAGKTWSMTYSDLKNNIYPNGIDCSSADHCIAVVEGDTCQILVTDDGGTTWTATHSDSDPKCSLTYVATLSDTEAWVGGGHLSYADFEGRFYHTLDGGKTWTLESVKGLYIFDLDMPSPTVGYAVGITESGSGVGLLKYDANPSSPGRPQQQGPSCCSGGVAPQSACTGLSQHDCEFHLPQCAWGPSTGC